MTENAPAQPELPLPFPELTGDLPLLPARMVNEYQYCPRLAYLEWVQGEWSESSDTVEGRHAHRRVDRPSGDLPDPADAEGDRVHARSIRCPPIASASSPKWISSKAKAIVSLRSTTNAASGLTFLRVHTIASASSSACRD